MSAPTVCPACGRSNEQPIRRPAGKRICCRCNTKIGKRHKWRFSEDGRPEHRDCTMPTGKPVSETMSLLI